MKDDDTEHEFLRNFTNERGHSSLPVEFLIFLSSVNRYVSRADALSGGGGEEEERAGVDCDTERVKTYTDLQAQYRRKLDRR